MGPAALKVESQQLPRNEEGGTQRGRREPKIPMASGDALGKVSRWEVMGRKGSPVSHGQNKWV